MHRRDVLLGGICLAASASAGRALARPQDMRLPTVKVLSIDGGGIRGIAAARILKHLDDALRAAGKRGVAESFDLFAGTSTGCLMAAGLAASPLLGNRFDDPAAIEAIYREQGRNIFVPLGFGTEPKWFKPKFRGEALRNVLKGVFGTVEAKALTRNFVGTYYNMKSQRPAVVARGGPAFPAQSVSPLSIADIAWASASAPTYFNIARINPEVVAADGGLFANNPAAIAAVEARRRFGKRPMMLVSIGCGQTDSNYNLRQKSWGVVEWADPTRGMPILDAVMRGQADSTDALLEAFLNDGEGDAYHRFQFNMSSLPEELGEMDDVSSRNLDVLTELADALMQTPGAQGSIKRIVDAV